MWLFTIVDSIDWGSTGTSSSDNVCMQIALSFPGYALDSGHRRRKKSQHSKVIIVISCISRFEITLWRHAIMAAFATSLPILKNQLRLGFLEFTLLYYFWEVKIKIEFKAQIVDMHVPETPQETELQTKAQLLWIAGNGTFQPNHSRPLSRYERVQVSYLYRQLPEMTFIQLIVHLAY